MIVEKTISLRRVFPIIWKRLAIMAIISTVIVVPMEVFDLEEHAIGMTTPLILGTALSIFLGFRTNSAYERWMNARGIFGSICASTRNLAAVLARKDEPYTNLETGEVSSKAPIIMNRMIRRGIALLHIFGAELRDDKDPLDFETVDDLLSEDDQKTLSTSSFPSIHLLFLQARDFRSASAEGQFIDGDHFEVVAIQRELNALINQAVSIKTTPFPTHYSYFTNLFVWLLVILMSLSLPANESNSIYVIPLIVIIGWIFSMIEGIGDYMSDPWVLNRNIVPMRFLAREHERQIRAIALQDKTHLPSVKVEDGALY